jgi:hypothetical protein
VKNLQEGNLISKRKKRRYIPMKKILLIALALGLAVALAAPAMATDWSARGHIWVGGAIHKTVPISGPPQFPFFNLYHISPPIIVPANPLNPGDDAWGDVAAWVRMGANLTITARQSEDLYGVLGFNMNSSRWGEYDTDATNAGSWYRQSFADDSGTLSVLVQEMFIDFRVPPKLPIWLRIGAQPFVIRPWLVVNTVGPGLTGRVMIDPIKLSINAGWAKKWEGYDWDCDDVDAFFGDIAMPIGPVRIGGFVWYENHGVWLNTASAFPPANYPDSGQRDQADIYWLGFYADGKIGPVGLQFDFVYEGGDINYDADWSPGVQDQDIRAWVIRGVLDVSPMDRLKVGLGALYASGQDLDDNDIEEYQSVNGPEAFGRQQGLPALQDFFMLTGGCMGIVPSRGPMASFFGGPVSIGGIWYIRAFADYMATDWLRLVANFGWIGDTRDHGNKLGQFAGPAYMGPRKSDGVTARDDDDIGFEMDFGFNIALYKNLQWGVGFSYLIAGDALDQWDGVSNVSPNDPWQLQSAILYTF